jgi:hypothetical protein
VDHEVGPGPAARVPVLLDPALGPAGALLQQALGPWFAVGRLPRDGTWTGWSGVVVLATADAGEVAAARRRVPGADLLVVTGGMTPAADPRPLAAISAAGADGVLASLSVGELAARVRELAGRRPAPRAAAPPAGTSAASARAWRWTPPPGGSRAPGPAR